MMVLLSARLTTEPMLHEICTPQPEVIAHSLRPVEHQGQEQNHSHSRAIRGSFQIFLLCSGFF
jgi:hypothetical protein